MQLKQLVTLGVLSSILAACGGGDISISPVTNADNSVGDNSNNVTVEGEASTCATYDDADGNTFEGFFDGTDCTYGTDFVDFNNPLSVDLTIPFIGSGAHIFQGSLWVGESYDTDAELVAAGITEGGDGPTLTVDAGVTIAHQTSADFMVVNRGSQMIASGNASSPITFTSASDVLGTIDPEAVSEWGGMVIDGFGVTNKCTYTGTYGVDLAIDGECHIGSEGSEGDQTNNYGGNNDADSSGTLEYVVVKHTGAQVANGDELNGITLGAVGSGTTISYVQAYSTYDDGLEFFGGAVNVDHYVGLYVNDDSLDMDEGYRGTIEYSLVIQSETDGNRCIEADGVGSHDAIKAASDIAQGINTQPTINQLTCIVSPSTGTHDPGQGWRLREGIYPTITNALVTTAYLADVEADNYCFRADDETQDAIDGATGDVVVQGSIFACGLLTNDGNTAGGAEFDFLAADASNQLYVTDAVLGEDPTADVANGLEILDGYYAVAVADMLINSAAITASAVNGATFIGGVSADDDWTDGWTYGLQDGNRGQALYFE